MNTRDRFWGVIHRTKIDRLPVLEWAPWWKDETIKRWHGEGLPADLTTDQPISAWFGLDDWRLAWIRTRMPDFHEVPASGPSFVRNREDYEAFQHHLWPQPEAPLQRLKSWTADHAAGRCVVWIMLEGFYWFPQRLLGIENGLMAYYDQPDLIKEMNQRLVEFHHQCLDQILAVVKPDFVNFAEDMGYNHGPIISKPLFDEFVAPYYRQIVPRLKNLGCVVMMDSDGLMDAGVPWLVEAGVDGLGPLERQAGVDVAALRRKHPQLVMLGAFDKMTMPLGREAMRQEFERLLPVMASGRFFASCDHQTPPGVSLENYQIYLELFREYAARAVESW